MIINFYILYSLLGNIEQNGILAFSKHVLFPLSRDGKLTLQRPEKWGGNLVFDNYQDLETAFANQVKFRFDLLQFKI